MLATWPCDAALSRNPSAALGAATVSQWRVERLAVRVLVGVDSVAWFKASCGGCQRTWGNS